MLGLREHLDHQLGERRLLVELQHERLVLVERLLEVVLAVADEVPVSQPGRWTRRRRPVSWYFVIVVQCSRSLNVTLFCLLIRVDLE